MDRSCSGQQNSCGPRQKLVPKAESAARRRMAPRPANCASGSVALRSMSDWARCSGSGVCLDGFSFLPVIRQGRRNRPRPYLNAIKRDPRRF